MGYLSALLFFTLVCTSASTNMKNNNQTDELKDLMSFLKNHINKGRKEIDGALSYITKNALPGIRKVNNETLIKLLRNIDIDKLSKLMSGDIKMIDIVKVLLKSKKENMLDLSPKCSIEIERLLQPFSNVSSFTPQIVMKFLASPLAKMLDSWAKPGERILVGNMAWVGAIDECESVESFKYCKSSFLFLLKFPGYYGSCVPKSCSSNDVEIIFQELQKALRGIIIFNSHGTLCSVPLKYPTGAVVTIVIISILVLLCLLGTMTELLQDAFTPSDDFIPDLKHPITNLEGISNAYEYPNHVSTKADSLIKVKMTRGNMLTNILICFSFVKNIKALFSTKLPKGAIGCINGMRFISMTWVILGHYYFFGFIFHTSDNSALMLNNLRMFSFLPISNAFVSVDTFFVLSGLLVAYLTLRRLDANDGMSIKQYLIYLLHRYLRLTPSLGMTMLVYVNIYPLVVRGPFSVDYRNSDKVNELCLDYWWTNLLYINNFYPKSMGKECIGWVWYLANDMQFYVVSPAVLLLFYYFDKKYQYLRYSYVPAFVITAVLCILSFVCAGLIIGINDYPTLISGSYLPNNPRVSQMGESQDILYIKPYIRVPAYLVGLLLGYIISRNLHFKSHQTRIANMVGWVLAIVVAMSIIYGPWHVYKPGGSFMGKVENLFYGIFHRFAWSVAVGWVIYSCHNKLGGMIDSFLSWKAFIPLSRMTYGAYLMHILVLQYYYQVQERSYHMQENLVPFHFTAIITLAYCFAFMLSVLLELPVANLEKMIFQ